MAKSVLIDKDLGWKELLMRVQEDGDAFAKIGVQQDTKREVKEGEDDPIDMIRLAGIHEFGAPKANIPERSFIRASHDAEREKITRLKERLMRQYIDGKITMRMAIKKLGVFMQGKMRKFLKDLREPELAPRTIARKGSDNPLIDTGQLLGAIHYVLVMRDKEVERSDAL